MKAPTVHLPFLMILCSSLLFAFTSCDRLTPDAARKLEVRAKLADIEWVIVDCHDTRDATSWVAKLTPDKDARLISELITGITAAKWKGATKTDGLGFIVFKHKDHSVEAFNFVELAPEVEIRPGFWSKTLARPLRRIRDQKIGWKRDDSLPEVRVREIQVWQYGEFVTAFRRDSPSFPPLVEAASEVLGALDPRWSMQGGGRPDPRDAARYQGAPQFVLFLDKPVKMYKLIVWWKKGAGPGAQIRYETFTSTAIALYMARFHLGIGGLYVAFRSDEDKTKWYDWDLIQAARAADAMGKPHAHKAFKNLLQVYEDISAGR